jgi:hypothetical protein
MEQAKTLENKKQAELSPEQLAAVRTHVDQVLSSEAFMGGHRAKHFFQLVVEHALAGELDCLRERMLGVEMFGRPIDYDTGNDAVVRVKASEVRRRLTQYYQSLSAPPTLQIELPAGSYAPQFRWAPVEAPSIPPYPADFRLSSASIQTQPGTADSTNFQTEEGKADGADATSATGRKWKLWAIRGFVLAGVSAVFFSLGWFAAIRFGISQRDLDATHPLWATLFDGKRNTYVVPADVGLDLLEGFSHSPMSLADYMKGDYLELQLPGVDPRSAKGLGSQRITSFADAQIIANLIGLAEYNPRRTFLRFPRDLRLDDLKNSNAVLVGSVGSNPWAAIADNNTNFHIIYRQGRESATIINEHPQPGEQGSYESHWKDPAHETFALIAFLPNMDTNGHLLLLEGLDVAGTQAAAETLFDPAAMAPILQRARRSDGSIRAFEILIRSTSINWNSTDSQVIATRIR